MVAVWLWEQPCGHLHDHGMKGGEMPAPLILPDESYRVMGACFDVYREHGSGFLEAVYQECLQIEMTTRGIPFVEKPPLQLRHKGHVLTQWYEPDFLCYDAIIVELKAVTELSDSHRAQVINYLKATGKPLGLLINFGHHPALQHERLINVPNGA